MFIIIRNVHQFILIVQSLKISVYIHVQDGQEATETAGELLNDATAESEVFENEINELEAAEQDWNTFYF